MRRLIICVCVAVLAFSFAASVGATLSEYGTSNEMFFDDITNLYWYDPIYFQNFGPGGTPTTRADVDAFIAVNSIWSYATDTQMSDLLNNYAYGHPSAPFDLSPLGSPTSGATAFASSWKGFYDSSTYDSVRLDAKNPPTGFISMVQSVTTSSVDVGAWLNTSTTAPPPAIPEPSTMLLLGTGLVGLAGFRRKFRN